MKINLGSTKPRVNEYLQPIKMEHPGAIFVEFGELHDAKIKKALQLQGFCGEDGIRTHDLLTASQAL